MPRRMVADASATYLVVHATGDLGDIGDVRAKAVVSHAMKAVRAHHCGNDGRLSLPTSGDSAGLGLLSENQPNAFTASIELLTAAELAKALKISLSSVRRLQEQRRIPFIKVGGRIRFSKADVANYLEQARVKAI